MEKFCLRTKLVEKPSVCFYYKGMEDDDSASFALNVVVSFTPAEAPVFDIDAATKLLEKLNEDRDSLLAHGYTEFEIIKKANSD